MIIEAIVLNAEDAKVAEENGVDRLELVSDLETGGLTPDEGMIQQVVESVQIPVNVMIRPHNRSFHYSHDELKGMRRSIETVSQLGAAGIVVGALNRDHEIDEAALSFLLTGFENLDVTFHRAFDEVVNQEISLLTLARFKLIQRILTSGGKPSVLKATDQIRKFVQITNEKHLSIMAGSGLTINSVQSFVEKTEVREIHFGRGIRKNSKLDESIDPNKIRELRRKFMS